MRHLDIPYGSQIALKSKYSQKYLGFKHQTQTLTAIFPPPSIHLNRNPGESIDMALRLKLLPVQHDKKDQPLLSEGSRVFLVIKPGGSEEYLTSTSKGELKFDKKSLNDEMNKMLFRSATWSVSYASTQKTLTPPSKTLVTPFDSMILKSIYGGYLTVHPHTHQCQCVLQMDDNRSVWNFQLADSLNIPEWLYTKPAYNKFLVKEPTVQTVVSDKRNLRSNPPDLQQAFLVEDILDISLGFEGSYIKRRPGGSLYVIQPHLSTPSCNIALSQLSYRILEITSHYEKLMTFIKELQLSRGVLIGALCDGLRKISGQYYQEIIQLDQQAQKGVSLQNMWVEIQDSLKIMRALCDLVNVAKNLSSGQLITCLQRLINETTDGFVLNVYKHIFQKLVFLYVGILSKWIYEGLIEDKYGQFMVKTEEQTQWTNWQERFTLRADQVPLILERDQQKILVTGKYLNILKACNREITCPFRNDIEQNLQYHISRQNFAQPIQRAYDWANQHLLNLVFKECKLKQVLNSLKGYYFLKFGDLFIQFLVSTEDDLITQKKTKIDSKIKPLSVQRLQNKFDVTVKTSSASNDIYNEEVSIRLDNVTLFEQVYRIKTLESETFEFDFNEKPFIKKDSKYIDFITLDFRCEFPLNLILNKKSLSKYQSFFRLLLWCKFLERQLDQCWLKLQSLKEMGNMECFKRAYKLNHRIVAFIKRLRYYFCEEVIEQNWLKLTSDLELAKNFQEIILCHDRFLNNCLKQSLLTNARLLNHLVSQIGGTIYNYMQLKSYLSKVQTEYNVIKSKRPTDMKEYREYQKYIKMVINDLIEEESYHQFLDSSTKAFDQSINTFLREIGQFTKKEENHLMRLSQMLDQQNFLLRKRPLYHL